MRFPRTCTVFIVKRGQGAFRSGRAVKYWIAAIGLGLVLILGVCFVVDRCLPRERSGSWYNDIVIIQRDIVICTSLDDVRSWKPGSARAIGFFRVAMTPEDVAFLATDNTIEVIAAHGESTSEKLVYAYVETPRLKSIKLWDARF